MLSLEDIHLYYGKSYILQGVSLMVDSGEVVGVLGRNGVGKTTTLRAIMGLNRPRSGRISFDGHEITRVPPHRVPRMGIGYVPQGRRIFPRLTIKENISTSVVKGTMNQEILDEIFEYFPILRERQGQLGGTLSGGEQQMLAIARAIIGDPRLLILDEPTEGLMPLLVDLIKRTISALNRTKNISVLLVEQNLDTVLQVCRRLYVMEKGTIKYEERIEDLDKNRLMQYLGV